MDELKKQYARIERKYAKKIDRLLIKYKDRPIGELWEKFDVLKIQMKADFDAAGIDLENT